MSKNTNKKAFTLIELMVVMGVVAVLATLSVVAIQLVQRSLRDTQRRDVMNTLNLAITDLQSQNDNEPPAGNQILFSPAAISFDEDADGTAERELVALAGPTQVETEGGVADPEGTIYCYHTNDSTFVIGLLLEDGGEFFIGDESLEDDCDDSFAEDSDDTYTGTSS